MADALESIESPVQATAEFRRVAALERRSWTDEQKAAAAAYFTAELRQPGSTAELWPAQGMALWEIARWRGAFCPIRVGGGKTLISMLAPTVLRSVRPLLVMPASLIEAKKREAKRERIHWKIPTFLTMVSYTYLTNERRAKFLESFEPDLIILDESHKAKNRSASVASRIERYLRARQKAYQELLAAGWSPEQALAKAPIPSVVALTGTITNRSLKDYAHILNWCLGELSPAPRTRNDLETWSEALDERKGRRNRPPGVLRSFATPDDGSGLDGVRKGYQRRLRESYGVVTTREGFADMTLRIEKHDILLPQGIADHIQNTYEQGMAPDGWLLWDKLQIWQVVRQLSQGFYYEWQPRPPDEWMQKRYRWGVSVRYLARYNKRELDTELQIARAVAAGYYDRTSIPDYGIESIGETYHDWLAIRDTFTPNPVPVWLDHFLLEKAGRWLNKHKGVCWVGHRAVGDELSRLTGLAFFSDQGTDASGRMIESAPGSESVIASIASSGTGRNLQQWSRGLVIDPSINGEGWEQLLARKHRPGQKADEVVFDAWFGPEAHRQSFEQALADARYAESTTGLEAKLLHCDIV